MALVTVDNEKGEDFRSKARSSANKKLDVVLRLLRGEKLEELSPVRWASRSSASPQCVTSS